MDLEADEAVAGGSHWDHGFYGLLGAVVAEDFLGGVVVVPVDSIKRLGPRHGERQVVGGEGAAGM